VKRRVHASVIAVWAALIATANLFPTIPIAFTGGTFSLAAALIPLAGVFFGPVSGALCAAIGQVIGQFIAPHIAWLGPWTFIVGTTNALVAGLVSRGRGLLASLPILAGWGLWYTTAIGRAAAVFPAVFYSLGLVAVVLGSTIMKGAIRSDNPLASGAGIWLASFAGFVGAAAVGNYIGILLLRIPAQVWKVLTFVAPVERSVFSLGAAIIGYALIRGLERVGVSVGPEEED